MRKVMLLLLMLALVATTALTACGSKNNDKDAANNGGNTSGNTVTPEPEKVEPFTVTLRHIQIGDAQKNRKAILDDVVKATEAEVAGLTIELDGVEDSANRFTKLPAEMAAGNPPLIFDLFGGAGDALKYAKAGRLLDLNPILDELGLTDQFMKYNQFVLDGKVYGLPIGGSVEGFYYNKTLFEKYNVAEPKTWEDLEKAAETFKANKITPFAMGSSGAWVPLMMVNSLIGHSAGPEVVGNLPTGAQKWNDPEVVAGIAKFAEWEKNGYMTKGELGLDYGQHLNEFVTGKAAMMFDGSWRSSVFVDPEQAGDLLNNVGFFVMPAFPGGKGEQNSINANFSNGYGFSAKANANELQAIKAFIKNLYNDEMQLRGLLEDGVIPSMSLNADAIAKVENPIVKTVIGILSNAKAAFPHFDSTVPSEVYTESETQIHKVIDGKASPQQFGDALNKVQEAAIAKQE